MNAGVQRPHDKLFRTVFADPREAESFLRIHLPPALSNRLDWSTLALMETSFVDEALAESESDLLYTAQMKDTAQPVYVYLLFEHQYTPDKWMRFRLLKYMCRIWDESFKEHPDQTELCPIIPLVFYQGTRSWRHSTEFADLFPENERGERFLPRFAHYLVDQSELSPEEVQGDLKARVAQLLLMAAFHGSVRRALTQAARLLAQLPQTGGQNYVEVFVMYLVATQERRVVQEFAETVRRHTVNIGGDMLTYAEELLQEGRQEGRREGEIKGKIEVIENLLAVGVDWSPITQATGITPDQLQLLKQQLRQLTLASSEKLEGLAQDAP